MHQLVDAVVSTGLGQHPCLGKGSCFATNQAVRWSSTRALDDASAGHWEKLTGGEKNPPGCLLTVTRDDAGFHVLCDFAATINGTSIALEYGTRDLGGEQALSETPETPRRRRP